jgi:transcriptional regulator with XRE-family HTH domain
MTEQSGQTKRFLECVKRYLKAQGKTYADLACALDVSEATVKRIFSEESVSLSRMDEICAFLGIQLTDLASMVEQEETLISTLTEDQEQHLVSNPKLLLMLYFLLNNWSVEEILNEYAIEEPEANTLLAQLDRLKLIDVLPSNHVKILVSRTLNWRIDGPIRKFFDQRVRGEFLQGKFDQSGDFLKFYSGKISTASAKSFENKLMQLVTEFHNLIKDNASLPAEERHGYSFMLAMREWEFSLFSEYRRD